MRNVVAVLVCRRFDDRPSRLLAITVGEMTTCNAEYFIADILISR